jgi:phosphoglycerate kinase
MHKKTIRDVDVARKRALVRVDFNVPLDAEQHITDDTRIRASLPTIQYLLDNGAAVILMSHPGRPKGEVNENYCLATAAQRLSELLGRPVQMAPDCIGPQVEAQAQALQPGQVLLLENLRFHKEEEKNDPEFARQLASLGEIYVDDAFGSAHRAHASTEGVTRSLPGVAGLLHGSKDGS